MTVLLETLEKTGLLFDVVEQPVFTMDGIELPGKKVLRNATNNEVISVMSSSYKTISNREVFTAFNDSLVKSGLDLTDMSVKIKSSPNLSRSMVDIILPAHSIETKVGDVTQMRITTLNSFDGSWRFMSRAGGIRLACLNGQVIGDIIGSYSSKHTSGFDMEASSNHIVNLLTSFNAAKEHWRGMMQTKVAHEDALSTIDQFLGGNGQIKDMEAFLKRKPVVALMETHRKYVAEMGPTAWALYNAFTDYVTHRKYGEDSVATALNHNEMKLIDLVAAAPVFH